MIIPFLYIDGSVYEYYRKCIPETYGERDDHKSIIKKAFENKEYIEKERWEKMQKLREDENYKEAGKIFREIVNFKNHNKKNKNAQSKF